VDAATVRIVLTAIAENSPSNFEPGEPAQAVAWLEQRIRITRLDKGGGVQYNPQIEAAARAAERAVALYQQGDIEAAKPLALEALKLLNG
jgi:hypothetical protein